VRHHQRRPVHGGDNLRHRKRLAGSGDAEQDLTGIAAVQPVDELGNGAYLIASNLEITDE
jgi:hypothetical protein